MEVLRLLLLALALAAVVALPVLIALVVCADEVVDRLNCGYTEWRERRRARRLIARLNQAVDADQVATRIALDALDRVDRRPLEQIAADLRCLRRERAGGAGPAVVWHSSVLDAYDGRLRLACRALGITEHLGELTGLDRQIERVRVEAELDAAGLRLRAARPGQHERHH
ncbi:hypothetical protein SAMN05443287_106109 [Micromonospora phaseoli]|uniref:Uncharacterized protein n=1 Tax=Micromonospora phaseoli TaxID=1144548 RepID=A0A1H7ATX7_9ACTN|nr:hypothetical protein [Micromonospora phaseoli]PZV96400.1 hypothetical protein CLV64_107279 [Micromonospora phaseoli]GIJ76087.1 hypothetical protein Xph01_05190 [Micromonospora phaseoli]SEJ64495.1 hypothetical protein SAMN05443287_106109 [Micromonospora phaseoli]